MYSFKSSFLLLFLLALLWLDHVARSYSYPCALHPVGKFSVHWKLLSHGKSAGRSNTADLVDTERA